MRNILIPFALLLSVHTNVNAQAQRGREPFDEAIDRGLSYLRQAQNKDGSWSANSVFDFGPNRNAGNTGDPAITSLAVMAFLSTGKVPGEGKDGIALERGIRFVMSRQQKGRPFAQGNFGGGTEMYYHGICTLMLAEASGMTEGKIADELKVRFEDAVGVILQAQRKRGPDIGGWRYQVNGFDSDLSVTGWQLMALRAGRNIGCDVPAENIKNAVDYINRCWDPITGGFRYTIQNKVTVPCTGTGILALELCGKEYHNTPESQKAGAYILKNPLDSRGAHFFYGVYYTSQGMFQLGENYWKAYRPKLHSLLLRDCPPNANGAWVSGGFDDNRYGPSYCTSMAILALTVEYRLLPIYQRFEEPKERDANEPDR